MANVKSGLEGVVVAQQDICCIDGENGDLLYRGYHIDELAPNASFEEIVYLLWHEKLPNKKELEGLNERLVVRWALNPDHLKLIQSMPRTALPMSVCRTGVSQIGLYDPEKLTFDHQTNLLKADDILAKMPTIMASFDRYRRLGRPHYGPVPGQPSDSASSRICRSQGAEMDSYRGQVIRNFVAIGLDRYPHLC